MNLKTKSAETQPPRRLATKKRGATPAVRRLALALVGILLGLGLYLTNAQRLGGNPMPMPFGTGVAVVLSGSMEPALHVNDLLIVREAESYRLGDIVVWQEGRTLVVHRVVSVSDDTLTTQGDANNVCDEPVALSAVRGRVTGRVPLLGATVQALKSPVGIIALLVLAYLLTERSFRREKAADSKELAAIREEIQRLRAAQDCQAREEKANEDKE